MNGARRWLAVLATLLVVVAGVGPGVGAGARMDEIGAEANGPGVGTHGTGTGAPVASASPVAGSSHAASVSRAAATSARVTGGAVLQADTPNCSFPITRADASGENLTVSEEPDRVVALGANIAQIAWAVGAEDKIVGMPVNPTTAYLNGSSGRVDIYKADDFHVAIEEVVTLEPDLVLAPNIIPNETVSKLRDAGLTVYYSPFGRSLADVYGEINQTGELLGACEAANRTVETVQARVNAIETAVAGEERPRVLSGTGVVPGNGTFVHEIMETAGGDNVAANANLSGYEQISNETILNRDPEWLVVTTPAGVPTTGPLANITAVRENQTIVVNPNYFSQPGPLVVEPMAEIARALHPEAIQAANLSNIANVSAFADSASATNGTNATDSTDATTGATTANTTGATASNTTGAATAAPTHGTTLVGTTGATTTSGSIDVSTTTGETATTTVEEATATTADTGETDTPDTGTETSSSDGPGFGVVAAAIALLAAGLLASRRRL